MFKVIESNGKKLVLKESGRKLSMQTDASGRKFEIVPLPNYQNTGFCLCGMLKPKQTIEEFTALYQLKKKGVKR